MPDIQLRFQRDMLVLSSPVDALLARQGADASRDREYLNIMEPDSIRDALMLEVAAGAQCVVTTTEDITQARLAHIRMDSDPGRLAQAALAIANDVRPQHVLAEIGPCGLPLDGSSKASLNENRAQYADAARAFQGGSFDAYFLNGFVSLDDLKCALMGVGQVGGKPVFASVLVGEEPPTDLSLSARESDGDAGVFEDLPFAGGYLPVDAPAAPPMPPSSRACLAPHLWPEALAIMEDLGVAVVGFETEEPIERAQAYAQEAAARTGAPILAQLRVTQDAEQVMGRKLVPLEDVKGYAPDTMASAAVKLYGAGVQFLRATGLATPAYTGSLAATVAGLDVRQR